MITAPSPRMVLPENMSMGRSLVDIGLTTISSVWNTTVDHDAEGLVADLGHHDEAVFRIGGGAVVDLEQFLSGASAAAACCAAAIPRCP